MSLNSVVNRVMEDLEQRGTDKKVKLVNAIPRNLILHIDGDRVQQVIFNLVDNAIKYGRHGGTVRVETPEYEAGQEMVEVAITDDGPGIPAESLDKYSNASSALIKPAAVMLAAPDWGCLL